jgi:hypothetical protein
MSEFDRMMLIVSLVPTLQTMPTTRMRTLRNCGSTRRTSPARNVSLSLTTVMALTLTSSPICSGSRTNKYFILFLPNSVCLVYTKLQYLENTVASLMLCSRHEMAVGNSMVT